MLNFKALEAEISRAAAVVLATDNDPTRYMINELCVKTGTPFVVGKAFTRGIGGEVFAFRPETGGCLACLESTLERTSLREGVREIDLVSDEERDAMYGVEVAEIKDSLGLLRIYAGGLPDGLSCRNPERRSALLTAQLYRPLEIQQPVAPQADCISEMPGGAGPRKAGFVSEGGCGGPITGKHAIDALSMADTAIRRRSIPCHRDG